MRQTTDVAKATSGAPAAEIVANVVSRLVVRETRTVRRVRPWVTGRLAVRVPTVPGPMVVSTTVDRVPVPVRALVPVRVRRAPVPTPKRAVPAVVRAVVVLVADAPRVATAATGPAETGLAGAAVVGTSLS